MDDFRAVSAALLLSRSEACPLVQSMAPKKKPAAVQKKPASAGVHRKPAAAEGAEPQARQSVTTALEALRVTPPEPNDGWQRMLAGRSEFGLPRPLAVALPCAGIDAAGHAMKHLAALGLQFATNNVYDLEDRYRDHLEAHLGPHMAPGSVLHLGSEDGNILDVSPAQIERPCDVLISGPPCPPWAGNGCKKGQEDARSHVFVKILQICILLIKCNELKMCVLENVKGVLHAQKGQTSFMEKLVAVLSKEAPEFLWSYTVLSAEAYGLPQQRTRVFLRGLRACFGPIPDPWPGTGRRHLREFLTQGLACVDEESLTENMRRNLQAAETRLLKMVTEGKVERADIIVLPLDRSEDGVFNVHVCINVTPTLLTGNRYLFCMSCDIDKPRQHREFCRFLHPSERMTLQGFPSTLLPDAPATVRIQGAGNAFPASGLNVLCYALSFSLSLSLSLSTCMCVVLRFH